MEGEGGNPRSTVSRIFFSGLVRLVSPMSSAVSAPPSWGNCTLPSLSPIRLPVHGSFFLLLSNPPLPPLPCPNCVLYS